MVDFVKSAIESNLRLDGRRFDELYPLTIIPNISTSSHGSSQVTFGDNTVQTICNFSVTSPDPSKPDEGLIELTIFGPTVFESSDLSQKNEQLSNLLYDLQFSHSFLDLKSLCILPGQFCWNLKIHSTIISSGGCLIDALSIGTLTSLMYSQIPSLDVIMRDDLQGSISGNLELKLSTEKNDLIEKIVDNMPIITSVGKVCKRDLCATTREEESCCDGLLSVAVDKRGNCIGIRANGSCFDLNSVPNLVNLLTQLSLVNFSRILST